jgi:hypothetical protein
MSQSDPPTVDLEYVIVAMRWEEQRIWVFDVHVPNIWNL